MIARRWRVIAPVAAVAAAAAIAVPVGSAAARGAAPCPAGVRVAQHVVAGSMVGETGCVILSQSAQVDQFGRAWTQVDIGLDGTVAGYANPDLVGGSKRRDITDVPNVLFPQFGVSRWVHATGQYCGTTPDVASCGGTAIPAASANTGLSVLYPDQRSTWNGRAVLVLHGQANDTPVGDLDIGPRGGAIPDGTFGNLFVPEWLRLGYAVIYVRRPASSGVPGTLTDGQQVVHTDESINDNVAAVLDMLRSGLAYLHTVGFDPSETIEYGHSAGTIWARLLNYSGLNTLPDGRHVIAGIFADDPGGGLPEPLSMPMGQLLGADGPQITYPRSALLSKSIVDQLVPEITLNHRLYESRHVWLPSVTYIDLKRAATPIYAAEHAGDVTRQYELAGVSHISNQPGSPAMTLDYGPEAESIMAMLQRWVDHPGDRRFAPPPTLVNSVSTSLAGRHELAHQVLIPATACPTGVRYPWPAPDGAPSQTGYAAFGSGLEPVNSQGTLVDVSRDGRVDAGDGVRDALPSMAAVWRSRHLPTTHGHVTSADMVACVRANTDTLVRDGMLSRAEQAAYLKRAAAFPAVIPW